MTEHNKCPSCGADEIGRDDVLQFARYACGTIDRKKNLLRGDSCKERQRRIQGIGNKIVQHAVELLDLAGELDRIACTCARVADRQPNVHAASCPIRMAWGARQMARPMCKVPAPSPASKDIRHLAEPFQYPMN